MRRAALTLLLVLLALTPAAGAPAPLPRRPPRLDAERTLLAQLGVAWWTEEQGGETHVHYRLQRWSDLSSGWLEYSGSCQVVDDDLRDALRGVIGAVRQRLAGNRRLR
jgi:hypothetical protein